LPAGNRSGSDYTQKESDVIRIVADHIVSPLGSGTDRNLQGVLNGESGIRRIDDARFSKEPFFGSALTDEQWAALNDEFNPTGLTRLEQMMSATISRAVRDAGVDLKNRNALLILATTKGNIDGLAGEVNAPDASLLFQLSKNLGRHFKTARTPLIISNACVSGLLAIINGARLIHSGEVERVVVCGGDLLTRFTLSGFQSFMAVSPNPCKPYDARRDGITLGEAAGTVVLTKSDDAAFPAFVGGASANDANHISGPSRTGEGLFQSIQRTLSPELPEPGMISTHGTATPYNDEMEAQAFNRSGLEGIPLHSLKGVYGHTLGAAGTIETILALAALKQQVLLPSPGYNEHGVTLPLNVTKESTSSTYSAVLKTSSGFGGCNAAALFVR